MVRYLRGTYSSVLVLSTMLAAGCNAVGQQTPATPLAAPAPLTAPVPLTAPAPVPAPAAATSAEAAAALEAGKKAFEAGKKAFDDYMARPEPLYKWEKGDSKGNVFNLKLTSQEWQGAPWTHRVEIVRPSRVLYPDLAVINVSMGSGRDVETFAAQLVANALGATVINLFNIPNQPLFNLREDDLISYSFKKQLETGDGTWPLLLPMTKSTLKAMDAVTDFTGQEWEKPITRYVITGGSKRGWTSWLVAAADAPYSKRVVGIVPMVYNNLNLQAQMPHQLETWGRYSEMIEDYTKRGLQGLMTTTAGLQLTTTVDPWTYRDRFTMPKLVVNAGNDRYWPLDAMNLYQAGLPGSTSVLYVPNAGHAMEGSEQMALGSAAAWMRRLADNKPFPKVTLDTSASAAPGAPRRFAVTISEPAKAVTLWVIRSATHDFRPERWEALPMHSEPGAGPGERYIVEVPAADAEKPNSAFFADAEFAAEPLPLHLSSQVYLWSRGE